MAQIRDQKIAVLFLLMLISISFSSQASIQDPEHWDPQEEEGRNSLEDEDSEAFQDDEEESYSRQDFPDEEKFNEGLNDEEAEEYDAKEDSLDEERNEGARDLSREVYDEREGQYAEDRQGFADNDEEINAADNERSDDLPEESNSNLEKEIGELQSASDEMTKQIKDLLESFDSVDTGLSDDAEVAQDAGRQENYHFAF